MAHPDYEEFEIHLTKLAQLHRGDLVTLEEGYFAIVIDPLTGGPNQGKVRVAVCNGTDMDVEWTEIVKVHDLPNSTAHANFQEWIHERKRT